ncbi:hypothetical protein FRC17_001602 [Serendipita sp. 399]|nr:hypothetical protein FRC17_001602 [Serendipita sp. 399]
MSSGQRRDTHNDSHQQDSTSNPLSGYSISQTNYDPNMPQIPLMQGGVYSHQTGQDDSFISYPAGHPYPQQLDPAFTQPNLMPQHLGTYPPQPLHSQYIATPNAPGWTYAAQPAQGFQGESAYNPQHHHGVQLEQYRSFTPQPYMHQQQEWVGVQQAFRPSTPQPESSTSRPQFVTAGGKVISAAAARPCPDCSAIFERNTDLQRHIRTNHTGHTPYKCYGCNQAYSRSDARGKHWKENPSCKLRHDESQNA